MKRILMQSLLALLALTVVTGIIYPLLVTAVAQLCCRAQAQGSLIERNGHLLGSALIGQQFDRPQYFWGRPSATTPQAYNGASSGGSNLGPTNPAQIQAVSDRVLALRRADPDNHLPIPVDLVTASASGLDPDISPAAAQYQVMRVARARGIDPARLRALIAAHTQRRQWVILGEARVNVLELNLALDQLH
jgi:K+-transporting ATPase ATPase C chain